MALNFGDFSGEEGVVSKRGSSFNFVKFSVFGTFEIQSVSNLDNLFLIIVISIILNMDKISIAGSFLELFKKFVG